MRKYYIGDCIKTTHIAADAFSNTDGFYDEFQHKFCPDFDGFGRNLNALNDMLRGYFRVYNPGEEIEVVWLNSAKSQKELSEMSLTGDKTQFQEIMEVFNDLSTDEPATNTMFYIK